ncbi:histidine kinase [Arthrobacter sp. H5]|uniref:sensor histidine kinase n=1 Tax=Arthrobacter sp. H5 TaxID=1267973 RepID=UPI00047F3000|nr:histidine kinase [Arthrobacter sp. H5]
MDVHHRLATWVRANPGRVDIAAAVLCYVVLALPWALVGITPQFLISSALIIPLAWRRSHPVPAAAAVALVSVGQLAFNLAPQPAQVSVLLMVYALAAYAPRWASFTGLGIACLGMVVGVGQFGLNTYQTGFVALPLYALYMFFAVAVVLLCWTFGDLARTRRLTFQALEDRARRLEVERQQERDLAAADERSHIAREMHDIVAHSLSVIITQADGARYAGATNPALATATLGTIAETGRASLREMRRLLGVLRGDEAASTRPLPTLADVQALVDTVERAGLEVTYAVIASPRRPLPAGAELTGYRVIQESLTNVLKHAGPNTSASVLLAWGAKGLDLTIDDDGRGAAPDPATAGAGQGIKGMAERLKLYDGTVDPGSRAGGGYRVHAFIPYTEA